MWENEGGAAQEREEGPPGLTLGWCVRVKRGKEGKRSDRRGKREKGEGGKKK
jgi:hypothetical protein